VTEKDRLKYCLAVIAVNAYCLASIIMGPKALAEIIGRFALSNLLFMMTVTDLKERMIYDVHFYALLLGGAVKLILSFNLGMLFRVVFFLILLGVLNLASKKNPGLGMGDSRVIACTALYFSFSRWMEVMIISLGCAMIYGLAGLIIKKATMKTEVPFMPFLLFGVLAEIML